MTTENTISSYDSRPNLTSDGKTRIKRSNFITNTGKEIKLTNDDRRALLKQFPTEKNKKRAGITIATGIGISGFGAVFSAFMSMVASVSKGIGIMAIIFAIPGLFVIIYGIREAICVPNLEKCVVKAYEFTVDAILIAHQKRRTGSVIAVSVFTGGVRVLPHSTILHRVQSISADEAARLIPGKSDIADTRVILCFGGNKVTLRNSESFSAIRLGISEGDKVHCAVLESEKYCYLSIY